MIKKSQIIEHLFSAYCVTKVLLNEKGGDYWRGCESEAWHIIFMCGLADEYFKWEKENGQFYGL